MKKIFTLFAMVLTIMFGLRAQIVTIDPASFQLHFNADEQDVAHSTVYNNSTDTRTLKWVRMVEGAPSQWTSTVCDKNNCYSEATSSMEFTMGPQSNGLLEVTIYPHDVSGQGNFEIYVYDVNDSANANASLWIEVVVESATGITDPIDGGISIYPIPAKNVLNVGFDVAQKNASIEIFNVVGQKLKTVNVSSGTKSLTIPVSDMKKGVYFVRIYSNGKEVMTKTFTKD